MEKYTAVYQKYVGMREYVVGFHMMEAETPEDVMAYVHAKHGEVTHLFKGFVEEV